MLFSQGCQLVELSPAILLSLSDRTDSPPRYFIPYLRSPILSTRISSSVRRRMQSGRTRFRCSSSCHSFETIQCLPSAQKQRIEIYQRGRFSGTKSATCKTGRVRRFSYSNRTSVIDVSVQEVSAQGPYL